MPMPKLLKVEPRKGYHIYVEYDDGARGEVDLSHNAGKGLFKAWDEPGGFERVHITEYDAVGWGNELDLCPNAVYFRLTGKTPEEMMPGLRGQPREWTAQSPDSGK